MNQQKSIEILKGRKGVRINTYTNIITVRSHPGYIGLGLWRHLDYLSNYCGYLVEIEN
jgi:hypothetical protein